MNYNEGKELVEQKVADFQKNEKMYLDKSFQETETRNRFIDPFFKALGWEFEQTGIKRYLWDVHREYSQKDNSSTKKPDYAFRLKGKLKFFVEAKAPWVSLTDSAPVYQAKRYAFSTNGRAPIVVITDFQEFRVFNSLQRPVFNNPMQGLIKEFDLTYDKFIEKWDLLYGTFSKEAVESGSLEILRGKISKATRTLDDEFLKDIVSWRETLARNIAIRNKNLSVNEINESVQRILDRLIFIRNLEDRNIQPEDRLLNIARLKENIYAGLIPIFSELDREYNGILFKKHFSEELEVDDKTIKDMIKSMCYPESPFQFDVIEPEILGRIYEKFLGSKIRLTENHQAKVEEKPEVRHAGGVYYTPQYIVDYIVRNTVGKLIDGLTPEEIINIKILDPACGSGSFLIGAYDYIIKHYEKFYSENKKNKKYKDDFFETGDEEVRLTLAKKGEILINNIFGVDIDREASEVAVMSLYLKLLEHGFYEGQSLIFMKGHVLPDLSNNIKCGNSLITRNDLYEQAMFGNKTITPFDWKDEVHGFGNIFDQKEGFDCVIGNPPYIRIQEMNLWYPEEAALYKKIFSSGSKGNFDIYVLFIEKGLSLLNEDGIFGMILPNKFMQQEYGEPIREILSKNNHVTQIVNFKDYQIFKGSSTYTSLLFLTKASNKDFKYSECSDDEMNITFSRIESSRLNSSPWALHGSEDIAFLDKFVKHPNLGSLCDNIFVGIQTSADKAYILDYISETKKYYRLFSKSLYKEIELEKSFLRHIISGVDVKKYGTPTNRQYVIFPYSIENEKPILISKKIFESDAPKTWEYLYNNKKILENRENGKMKGEKWYGFVYLKNMAIQNKSKICVPRLVQEIQAIYDENGEWCLDNVDVGGVILKKEYRHLIHYILGLLNSKILSKYLSKISTPFRGGFWSCNRQYLEKLPIYIPDETEKEKFELSKKIEELVKQILILKKDEKKQADADFLEKKIDELVERIYLK